MNKYIILRCLYSSIKALKEAYNCIMLGYGSSSHSFCQLTKPGPLYQVQLNFDSSKSWDLFYKSESPIVRIKFALRAILACKKSPHNNNMSSKWQRNEASSQPVRLGDQVFELSVFELSRFYCISTLTKLTCPKTI